MNKENFTNKEEKNDDLKITNSDIMEKLTRKLLMKIRENEASLKKEDLKTKFQQIIEKEIF